VRYANWAKRIAFVAAIGVMVFSSSLPVVALSAAQKKSLQLGIYYFNKNRNDSLGCSSTDSDIPKGPGGTGPLYGPRFPKISDKAKLIDNIRAYIQDNYPDSGLKDGDNPRWFVQFGEQYDVNPVMLVLVGVKETGLGTDGGVGDPPQHNFWGRRGDGPGGFSSFANYKDSIEEYNKNLRRGLYDDLWAKGDAVTVSDIIFRATPPSDGNDTAAYVAFINATMGKILDGLGSEVLAAITEDPALNSCLGGGGGSVGSVSTAGYAFPVAPQRQSQNSGLPFLSALPCGSGSCHHDGTAAFDIGRQPGSDASAGAPVYAITNGTVDLLHIYDGIAGCFSLQFHSSKDNYWYWYGHLQNPRVTNGQTVKAGTQIAEVGLRKCTGNGSDPHVHIDRGCVEGGVPQKGGRESCRDPGMTPLINSLFNSLPG